MRPSRVLIPLLLCLIGRAAPVKFAVTGDGGAVCECDHHLVLVGTSETGELVRALQASELLLQVAGLRYPGHGKALLQFASSPFALGQHVIFIGASDDAGLEAGLAKLIKLIP
jgi:hypothetical protein